MDVEQAIHGRRSVRSFQDKPVPREYIDKILMAGAAAPSAMNRQLTRFIVIEDRKMIRELSKKVKEQAGLLGVGAKVIEMLKKDSDLVFFNAPLLILIVEKENEWASIDCSLAAQNMMLQAYDLGIGSCFVGYAEMLSNDKEALKRLGIESGQRLYCPLVFGYPSAWPEKKMKKAHVQGRF